MTDPNEISALKASFRGAVATADALHAIRDRIEALDVHAEISAADLDELSRVTHRARIGVRCAARARGHDAHSPEFGRGVSCGSRCSGLAD